MSSAKLEYANIQISELIFTEIHYTDGETDEMLPFDSVNISHSNAFEKCNNQQWITASETIHELKNVTASAVRKHDWYEETR